MPEKEKKAPENEDKAKENTKPEKEKEGAEKAEGESPEAEKPQSDGKQADENGEGAKAPPEKAEKEGNEPPTGDNPESDNPEDEANTSAVDAPAADNSAMELLNTKAQLAAFKCGVRADVVEDAVCIAVYDAQKTGTVNSDSITEALKAVLDRHPEWKNSPENNNTGFRVGADGTKETPSSSSDEISKIFGNK